VLSRSPTHRRLDGGGHGPHFVAGCVPPHDVFGTRYGTKLETILELSSLKGDLYGDYK